MKWISLQPLRSLPEALQRRVLRSFWAQCHPSAQERSLSHQQTNDLLQLVQKGRQGEACPLPFRESARLGWTALHLEPGTPQDMTEYPAEDGVSLSGCTFRVQNLPSQGQPFPRELLQTCTLRTLQPGDWIRPFGMEGRQKMKDYFAKRHIDAGFRNKIPLLCRGEEVLMACGVGTGDVPKRETVPADGV